MFDIQYENYKDNVVFTKVNVNSTLQVTFANLGASVFEIKLSSKSNCLENILVTPPKSIWLENRTYAGSIIGPLAGRYETGTTSLEQNRPPLHFHGGSSGWDTQIWQQTVEVTEKTATITFFYEDSNYAAHIVYELDCYAKLTMKINVQCIKKMFINPTNHMYFNLNGTPHEPVSNHFFQLSSDGIYDEENGLILSSQTFPIPTELNFVSPSSLNRLKKINGINTTYHLGEERIGSISHPSNGRKITIRTSLPSVVIYTFNVQQPIFTDELKQFPLYSGITFECQYPANNLNLITFDQNNPYYSETSYEFFSQIDLLQDS
ncbi:aldose epimerase family protein [Enterococcus sp. LJL90]